MKQLLKRLLSEYGILAILFILLVFFSLMTIEKQTLTGASAGAPLARQVLSNVDSGLVMVFTSGSIEDSALAKSFKEELSANPKIYTEIVHAGPPASRKRLEQRIRNNEIPAAIVTTYRASRWRLIRRLDQHFPTIAQTKLITVEPYMGSNFLKRENLLNVADQITVIAIIAIGMTMVIITGNIDLSVGSLVALSAVTITYLIQNFLGASDATISDIFLAGSAAILVCGVIGFLSGIFVTFFRIPSFIVTLSTMLIASGLAFTISEGQSIYQVPDSFIWLGRGRILGIPASVWIMIILFILAHLVMSKMVFGRYVYAIGGNQEASRLSGVPINKIIIAVFTVGGLLAGLGGIILASQLNSGSPTYGLTYELFVIAAVVVGGTSLMGGEGKIWGTLIGALIIGVIQNGMNLVGVESYTQKIVLGLLILGALIIEKVRGRSWV